MGVTTKVVSTKGVGVLLQWDNQTMVLLQWVDSTKVVMVLLQWVNQTMVLLLVVLVLLHHKTTANQTMVNQTTANQTMVQILECLLPTWAKDLTIRSPTQSL